MGRGAWKCIFPKKIKLWYMHRRLLSWWLVCPSKRATCLSLKKGDSFVPQKGQPVNPSIRVTCLSLNKSDSFVSQKGLPVCPSIRVTFLSRNKDGLCAPQNCNVIIMCKSSKRPYFAMELIIHALSFTPKTEVGTKSVFSSNQTKSFHFWNFHKSNQIKSNHQHLQIKSNNFI